jgi:hypothetical protein
VLTVTTVESVIVSVDVAAATVTGTAAGVTVTVSGPSPSGGAGPAWRLGRAAAGSGAASRRGMPRMAKCFCRGHGWNVTRWQSAVKVEVTVVKTCVLRVFVIVMLLVDVTVLRAGVTVRGDAV